MNLLKAEPNSLSQSSAPVDSSRLFEPSWPPVLQDLCEKLALLVSTGKATEEAIGVQLTQQQVKLLDSKDVKKYYKRYETYMTETFVNSFISLYTRAVGAFVPITETNALQNELKKITSSPKSCPPLSEMWAAASCSQHDTNHRKTYRFNCC